jgi:hypothetical protein
MAGRKTGIMMLLAHFSMMELCLTPGATPAFWFSWFSSHYFYCAG